MPHVAVYRVATAAPQDVSGLETLLEAGRFAAEDVLAAIGKTEGNGGSNDFTKDFAIAAIQEVLQRRGADPAAVYFIMSGGCEGVMSPHVTYLVRSAEPTGLRAGWVRGDRQHPRDLGRQAQARTVADLVRQAQRAAGIADESDIHFVQVRCPTLSAREASEARTAGQDLATFDLARSAALSRGASALGVALALGEVDEVRLAASPPLTDWDVWTRVGNVSSEIGTAWHEALVVGVSAEGNRYRMAHGVMRDALDAAGCQSALRAAGVGDDARLAALFAKCEPDPRGQVRGWRHTMLTDADVGAFRHARGAVAAVLASVCGDPALYVSGGAEHQGPLGGGTLAVIAERM